AEAEVEDERPRTPSQWSDSHRGDKNLLSTSSTSSQNASPPPPSNASPPPPSNAARSPTPAVPSRPSTPPQTKRSQAEVDISPQRQAAAAHRPKRFRQVYVEITTRPRDLKRRQVQHKSVESEDDEAVNAQGIDITQWQQALEMNEQLNVTSDTEPDNEDAGKQDQSTVSELSDLEELTSTAPARSPTPNPMVAPHQRELLDFMARAFPPHIIEQLTYTFGHIATKALSISSGNGGNMETVERFLDQVNNGVRSIPSGADEEHVVGRIEDEETEEEEMEIDGTFA
ncbi:hypothetical protein L226DRAFT_527773, partial [Lentinus tigrinus ALCF2SS1-7]|uniref:uncharacterized protein n=1 Tax=Lentinus tigrinus ALCF2SS1-7 TaxID=1328758 RepID=UPI00116635A9